MYYWPPALVRLGYKKQATVKREILPFPPFLLCSLTEETGYKRAELGLFEGPCNVIKSGELRCY